MRRIILITGGQRSGKSQTAERMALQLSDNPVYLATAHIWDEEFKRRVEMHQRRRGPQWTNIEEEKELSRHNVEGRVVVVVYEFLLRTREGGMGTTNGGFGSRSTEVGI